MYNTNRKDALKWWEGLPILDKALITENWKENTDDSRRKWSMYLIASSSSCIETIYNFNKLNKII